MTSFVRSELALEDKESKSGIASPKSNGTFHPVFCTTFFASKAGVLELPRPRPVHRTTYPLHVAKKKGPQLMF